MCGIVAILDKTGAARMVRSELERMTRTLVHRGPDAQDYYESPALGIGVARLAIVDPDGGRQPMSTPDGQLVWACNGEIFNYIELRGELERRGHRFHTRCDIEVIGPLYQEYGEGMLSRLNGQFALVLYDARKALILAARDPIGIAPLFWTEVDGLLLIGSEIKSLLAHPSSPREVDLVGLDQVFTLPGLVGRRTLFRGIRSLPPGHLLRARPGSEAADEPYWDLDFPAEGEPVERRGQEEWLDELDELLLDSVRLRLRGDAPVGVYLSGGLDSMLVADAVRRVRGPDAEIHTFAIDFTDPLLSEGKFQRLAARWLRTLHHGRPFERSDIAPRLRKAIWHTECALKETFNTAALALSELVHDSGMRVVLTGQGADELFAGYIGYRFDEIRRSQPDLGNSACSPEEVALRERLWGDAGFFYEKNYSSSRGDRLRLYSPVLRERFSEFDCLEAPLADSDRLRGRHPVHQRSYLDIKFRLAEHLLGDLGDRMTYAHSVEGRHPFLDPRVVDLARRLPPSLKLHDLHEKYLLKLLGMRYLPRPFTEREKFGFAAPGVSALLGGEFPYIDDMLSYDRIRRQGIFDPDEVEHLKARYQEPGFRLNVPFEEDLLATVLTFSVFLDVFDLNPGV
ncbi:MAG: asparagine synthase (glutamine-hydrolyzing) [Planctomycetales bacterium 71-10]|nr:MAG: asparagine synthase (glutamine-hydrolyzing) [Planctomycetales bacterium 71-10]